MMNEKGVSLIELVLVVIAVAVLAILVASLPASITSIRNSGNTSLAKEIASKELDLLRKTQYDSLPNGNNSFSDSKLSGLLSGAASYEIADCPVSVCTSGELAKQVKVTVGWSESGKTKTVELTTLVSKGGLGQ